VLLPHPSRRLIRRAMLASLELGPTQPMMTWSISVALNGC